VSGALLQIGDRSPARAALERDARRLAWIGNAWHVVELVVALAAGVAAGSVALVGFGLDSAIELGAGSVVVWLFSGVRGSSALAERRAQRVIAASYAILVLYLVAESLRDLLAASRPGTSWIGIALASVTVVAMPLLARAKRTVGRRLGSSAAVSEAQQNQICAYLSVALLAGLLLNALAGWWWADPSAALAIAGIAGWEGREAWRGRRCDCC
jgi:divalent metal cation (Fe/Co/Zn/Cd) transporter